MVGSSESKACSANGQLPGDASHGFCAGLPGGGSPQSHAGVNAIMLASMPATCRPPLRLERNHMMLEVCMGIVKKWTPIVVVCTSLACSSGATLPSGCTAARRMRHVALRRIPPLLCL